METVSSELLEFPTAELELSLIELEEGTAELELLTVELEEGATELELGVVCGKTPTKVVTL